MLLEAIPAGISSLTWEIDTVADAAGYDAAAGRYRNLRSAVLVTVRADEGR